VITGTNFSGFPSKRVYPLLSNRHFYEERVMTTWAAEEFAGAELGDGRSNRRLIKLAANQAAQTDPGSGLSAFFA
jgi:hypothetical protein